MIRILFMGIQLSFQNFIKATWTCLTHKVAHFPSNVGAHVQ